MEKYFSVSKLDKFLYPPSQSRWSILKLFSETITPYLSPDSAVLDLGAGTGQLNAYDIKGRVKSIIGIDSDPRVITNPLLDRGIVGDLAKLPFPDQSFDVVFSIYVLEHIPSPEGLASEICRVLRPGGVFIGITPNKLHYVSMIAALTPTWVHKRFNRFNSRGDDDTFPTFYKMNTRRALRKWFVKQAKMDEIAIRLYEFSPYYLRFSLPTFVLGTIYERIVNRFGALQDFRVNIICEFRKDRMPEHFEYAA